MKRSAMSFLSGLQVSQETKFMHSDPTGKPSAALATLAAGVEEIRSELVAMVKNLDDAKVDCDKAKSISATQIETVNLLMRKYSDLLTLKSVIAGSITDLQGRLSASQSHFSKLSTEITATKEQCRLQKAQLEKVSIQVADSEKKKLSMNLELTELKAKKESLSKDLRLMAETRRQAETDLIEMRRSVTALTEETASKAEQLRSLQTEASALKKKITALQGSNENLTKEIADKERELDDKRRESEAMQATVDDLRREIAEIDLKIDATVRTQEESRQSYERNSEQAANLQRELAQLESQLEVEIKREHQLREELAQLESSVEAEAQNEQSMKQEIIAAQEQAQRLEAENKLLHVEVMQKETHLSELTHQLQLIRQKIADEKANCLAVERQIELENQRHAEQMQAKKNQVDALRQKKALLERELEHENTALSMQEAKCETMKKAARKHEVLTKAPKSVATPKLTGTPKSGPPTGRSALASALFEDDIFAFQ
jgi:chromosome segregation ATPase